MAKQKGNNEVKHSKNVMQESQLSAERDMNIGDSNYFINLSINHWFLIGIVGLALLFYLSQLDTATADHSQEKKESNEIPSESEKEQTLEKQIPPEEKGKQRVKTPKISPVAPPRPLVVINTLAVDAANPLRNAATSLLKKHLRLHDIPCVAKGSEGQCRQELYCELTLEKDTVEIGMTTQVKILFYLDATLKKIPEQTVLATDAISSDAIYLPVGASETDALKQWLSSKGETLFSSLLSN